VSRGEDTVAEKKLRYVVEQVPDWLPTNRSDIANGKGGNSAILDVRYVLHSVRCQALPPTRLYAP